MLNTQCTHYSMVIGDYPWTQTPVNYLGRRLMPFTLCRCGAPYFTLRIWYIPPQVAYMMRWLLLFPVRVFRKRGWPWGRIIDQAEGLAQGTCSGHYQERSLSVPRFPSVVYGTPWLHHGQAWPGDWGVRCSIISWWCRQPMRRLTWIQCQLFRLSRPLSLGSKNRSFVY